MRNTILSIPYAIALTGFIMGLLQFIFELPQMELISTIVFCIGFISIGVMVSLIETESFLWNRVVFIIGTITAGAFTGAFYAGVFASEFQPVENLVTPDELLVAYRYHIDTVYSKARVIMLIVVVILLFLRLILSSKGLLLKDR